MRHSLLKLLCGLALFTPALALAQVSLSIGDLTVEAGESDRAVATLTTDGTAVALQFDLLYDPAVVSVGTVNGGAALTLNHAIASNPISAGRDRVVITSTPVTPLNAGPLADINFTINGSAAAGTTDLIWDAVIIGDGAANAITPAGLTNGQITITVTAAPPPPPPPAMPAAPVPASPFWALALLALLILGAAHHHQGRPRGPGSGWQHGRQRRSGPMALPSLALLLCLLPVAPTTWAQNPLPGDANNDGVIDGQDVVLIVEQILELGVIPGDGDCNEDDVINVLDTICSQQAFVPGDTTPIILGPGDRSIPAGVPFEMVLFAADPDENAALTWALLSGPAGLVVGADGVLTWTPTAGDVGDNPVSVDVTDETDRAASATFTITVFTAPAPPSGNGPPVLNAPGNQSLPVNTPLAAEASATDPDAGDVLTYSLVNAPAGMSINPTTGAISWTPQGSQAGAADVVVQVTDSAGNSDFGSFIVTANGLNGAPTANDDLYVARKGETLVIPALEGVILNDEDPNDDPLSATKLTDPGKGTLDTFGADGGFSYTPVDPPAITIAMQEECSLNISGGGSNTAISAADVDGDGDIELVDIRNFNTTDTEVFIVDPTTCTETRTPVFGMGVPYIHGLTTAVNLDADPELELVKVYHRFQPDIVADRGGQGTGNRLYAVNLDGTPLDEWVVNHGVGGLSAPPNTFEDRFSFSSGSSGPTATDLNGDGIPELLLGYISAQTFADSRQSQLALVAWDGFSGDVLWEFVGDQVRASNRGVWPVLVDLDLDGDTEIVFNHHVLDHNGDSLFDLPHDPISGAVVDSLTSAIANFDNDAFPEIIAYDESAITLYSHDGQIQWRVDRGLRNFGFPYSGLTVAELDGDPLPEFVFTANADTGNSAVSLFAFDDNGDELWGQADRGFAASGNGSEASTPVAFDFDGDGIDELIQQKGAHTTPSFNPARPVDPPQPEGIYIFDGATGDTIDSITFDAGINSGQHTLTVADVDQDGSAEILAVLSGGLGRYELQVLEGITGEPWPGARGVRFQSAMEPTYRNIDGSVPTAIEPHWLQPGRNAWNRVVPNRDPSEPEQDSFTYRVSDGVVDSNTATVNIELRPAGNPPFFLSDPVTGASRGVTYEYTPLTVDIDPGDVVTYALVNGPAGMSIDGTSGALAWYADVAGVFPVSIVATDTLGLSSAQIFTVTVGDPVLVPDVVGLTEGNAETALAGANLTKGSVFIATDPSVAVGEVLDQSPPAGAAAVFGSPVALTISSGPGPFDADDDNDGFSENQGDCDDSDDRIFPGAADPNGDGIDQDCDGIDGNKTLVAIELTPRSKRILTGQSIPLTATGIFEDGTAQDLTGLVAWTNGPSFSSPTAGDFVAQASFQGITGMADFEVLGREVDDLAPVAKIESPAPGAELTAPTAIVGTISDSNILRWELAYRYAGEDNYILFAEGETAASSSNIAEFDPTTLLNGLYDIRLRAYDRGGNVSQDTLSLRVEEQLKVGNFTLRYVDLELPLNGVPITLARTYDSRDKRRRDFGVGWSLGVNSIEIQTNRELGTAWRVFRQGLTYGIVEEDAHIAAIRLPGDIVEAFQMVVSPAVSPVVPFPPFTQSVSFRPLPGTLGSLEALGENTISILDAQPGPVTLRLDSNASIYNPTLFRYTTPDGMIIDLDINDGIQRAETPAGQVLTFTPNSITHSNGTVVAIDRDSLGRITRVTDPGGFTQDYSYDANGDLRSHRDQEGFVTRFDYDAMHNVVRITDPLGRPSARNEYDDDGRLISTTDANGDTYVYNHDVGARQEEVTDPDGFVTVLNYDDAGNVLTVTDPLGGITTNTYDADQNLLSTTNALGETTSYTYDTRRRLLSETDPNGATMNYEYDERDQLVVKRDPLGRITRYEYDDSSRLVTVVDALGVVTRRDSIDGSGNVVATEDGRGFVTQFAYNNQGFRTSIVDANGNQVRRSVTANGYIEAVTDGRGNRSRVNLDGRGFPSDITLPSGANMSSDFNGMGEFAALTDELGNASTAIFDGAGRITRYVDPDGKATDMRFDGRGNRTAVVDATGRETGYVWDAMSRMTQVILPGGAVAKTSYNAVGRKVSETDPNGNLTSYEYDPAGRNTAIIDALGQRTEFTYDLVGNLVARLDARGNTTRYVYDALNRLIKTEYADGSEETIAYDEVGNVSAEIDRLGRTKSYTYDAIGNLLTVTESDGGVTTFTYDANNNRVSQIDANGHTTNMAYDANDRMIAKTYPDGSTERYEYDAGNRISRMLLPDGKFIDATYDGFGRPTGHDLNGEATESFTYDGVGRLVQATNLWGTVEYSYDLDGRVSRIASEGGHSVSYTYDHAGNRTTIGTELSGQPARITTYSYDALNRLATIVEPDGDTTTYRYDPVGNVASITYPNGVISSFTYDNVNQLTRIDHRQGATTLATYDYSLDAGGRRQRVDHANGDSVSYRYDAADRLLRETHRDASNVILFEQTFTYDDVGNRLTQQISGQAQTVLAYDSADKLLSAGATRFAYDANGRLVSKTAPQGTVNYVYDVEGQLLQVTNSSGTVVYGYDANGKRRLREENAREQNFLLDERSMTGFDQTLVAFDENDQQLVEFHWGDRLISADDGADDRFYHFDANKNTRLLTDDAGSTSDTYDYDAFGNVINRTGVADSPYGFAGEWQDEAEGLVFLRARFYDPQVGRFISRDPFGGNATDPVSLHRYLYANANPIMNTDPSGELALLTQVKIGAAIGFTISFGTSLYAGDKLITAIGKGVIGAIFGAGGALLGAGGAAVVEAQAAARLGAEAIRFGTNRFLVAGAHAFGQGLISAVWGVLQLGVTMDRNDPKYNNGEFGATEALKLFLITFVMEFATRGIWQPAMGQWVDDVETVAVAASPESKSAAAKQLLSSPTKSRGRQLFRRWDGSEDALSFVTRTANSGGRSASRSAARAIQSVLDEMSEEADVIIRTEFVDDLKLFNSEGAAAAFIESMKGAASPLVDKLFER